MVISGGGGGGGNWGGDRELQETPDTVFITGLDENIVEEDLMAHFGSIGIIKVMQGSCWGETREK